MSVMVVEEEYVIDECADDSISPEEEFAMREFLRQEKEGTLVTYTAHEVRRYFELAN